MYQRWDSRAVHEKYLEWRKETGKMAQLESNFLTPQTIRYFEWVDA